MIVIVDYGVGNLNSIKNMFKKAGVLVEISSDPSIIRSADKILLPGMGHFDNCMQRFNDSGFRPIIEEKVFIEKIPVLGICVGLQMFMQKSEEGVEPGLGWISGITKRFNKDEMSTPHKIPNMGWLDINIEKQSKLLIGLKGARFYFAHSYHIVPEDQNQNLITASYGYEFTCGIESANIYGVQFHPEKSHRFGMQLLRNFSDL